MTFEFKIQLKGVSKPPVWRRLQVPDSLTFEDFHYAIQHAFGWYNCHMFSFSSNGYGREYEIQIPYEFAEGDVRDAGKIKLKNIFKEEKETFTYIYDFGDDWTHKIKLEKIKEAPVKKPICIAGKGKCPPEDSGGIWGYEELLKTIKDPKHPEYEEMREWLGLDEGEKWDVKEFDLEEANNRM